MQFELDADPSFVCICHCASCRRVAGAPMVAWATFPRAALRITHGALAQYESSPGVRRGHCARCGTSLAYCNDKRPGSIDLTLASLYTSLQPSVHIWVEDKLPWVRIEDNLPRYSRAVPADAS